MEKNKIEETRSKFIADCEEKSWRLECGAAFDQIRIEKLNAEQKKAIDNSEELKKQLKEAMPSDKSRKAREEFKAVRADLEPQIADATEYIQEAEKSICAVRERIFNGKSEAKSFREKAEFAKNFEWKEEVEPEEEVKPVEEEAKVEEVKENK